LVSDEMTATGLISVIVAVYNTEKYLEECVESLLSQTYPNIEIILVDDGSPDRCGNMCDDFAEKDSRISVIHKENGGLISARNAGLDIAAGEYFCFVDSDDYVDINMYALMHERIRETGADVCICGFRAIDDERNSTEKRISITDNLNAMQVWELYLTNPQMFMNIVASPWNKLVRRSLLRDNNSLRVELRLPAWPRKTEDGQAITDSTAAFNVDCIAAAKNGITILEATPYVYRIIDDSSRLSKLTGTKNMELHLNHYSNVVGAALPHKKAEIEAVSHYMLCSYILQQKLIAITKKIPNNIELSFNAVKAILKCSPSIRQKCDALLVFFLPNFICRAVYEIVRKCKYPKVECL